LSCVTGVSGFSCVTGVSGLSVHACLSPLFSLTLI